MNDTAATDPRLYAIPDIHGHAKGEHKAFIDERPIPLSARMLFLWFYHACRRGWPRFMMVTDHMNYLTFEDPAAINLVRRALKLAQAGDLYGAAETASVEVGHAAVVSEGLRRGMRYSIGAEVDNDPRARPDAQNIVDAMKPDGMIRSVHFLTIDHPTHGPNWNWPFDNPEFADVYETVGTAKTWELYMATLLDALDRLPGNILGHFYVPAVFGHWPDDATLDAYENQIVDACEARGMAIEFNTRFLYRDHPEEEKAKYLAAHRRLLAKCKAKNVGIAVGSDAHSPKDQGRAFATVLALLDECDINELTFPIAGRLARVALRVERKVEVVPEPPALAPVEDRKLARRVRPIEPADGDGIAAVPPAEDVVDATKPKRPAKRAKPKTNGSAEPTVVTDANAEPVNAEPVNAEPVTAGPSDPVAAADHVALMAEPSEALRPAPTAAPAPRPDRPSRARVKPAEQIPPAGPVVLESESIVDEALSDIVNGFAADTIVDVAVVSPLPRVVAEAATDNDVDPPSTTGSTPKSPPKTVAVKPKAAPPVKLKSVAVPPKSGVKKSVKPGLKTAAKKSPAKNVAAKKGTAKKGTAKKTATKKAPTKKPAVRPATAKKAAAKKSTAKKVQPKKQPRRR